VVDTLGGVASHHTAAPTTIFENPAGECTPLLEASAAASRPATARASALAASVHLTVVTGVLGGQGESLPLQDFSNRPPLWAGGAPRQQHQPGSSSPAQQQQLLRALEEEHRQVCCLRGAGVSLSRTRHQPTTNCQSHQRWCGAGASTGSAGRQHHQHQHSVLFEGAGAPFSSVLPVATPLALIFKPLTQARPRMTVADPLLHRRQVAPYQGPCDPASFNLWPLAFQTCGRWVLTARTCVGLRLPAGAMVRARGRMVTRRRRSTQRQYGAGASTGSAGQQQQQQQHAMQQHGVLLVGAGAPSTSVLPVPTPLAFIFEPSAPARPRVTVADPLLHRRQVVPYQGPCDPASFNLWPLAFQTCGRWVLTARTCVGCWLSFCVMGAGAWRLSAPAGVMVMARGRMVRECRERGWRASAADCVCAC
jgi:hypothetical protein